MWCRRLCEREREGKEGFDGDRGGKTSDSRRGRLAGLERESLQCAQTERAGCMASAPVPMNSLRQVEAESTAGERTDGY